MFTSVLFLQMVLREEEIVQRYWKYLHNSMLNLQLLSLHHSRQLAVIPSRPEV